MEKLFFLNYFFLIIFFINFSFNLDFKNLFFTEKNWIFAQKNANATAIIAEQLHNSTEFPTEWGEGEGRGQRKGKWEQGGIN